MHNMFSKMKGKGLAEAKKTSTECPVPTGDSDYDLVERLEGLDEQTDDYAGFPTCIPR